MSYRLSSSIITNNEKKYVTWLVTDLHEFVRLINLEICNEQAMLCGLGFEQLADDRDDDDLLCVPSFVTRLRNENETALRAFLKNFFELCFENDDVHKVSRGRHTRFEMDAATMRRLLTNLGAKDDDDCMPESISNDDDDMEVDGTEPVESGERRIPIVGLKNEGINDCFFNAAFQCLAHTQPFAESVLNQPDKWREVETRNDGNTYNWFVGVRNLMGLMCDPNGNSFSISEAKKALMRNLGDSETLMPDYEMGQQADAFDCFNAMLLGMHKSFPTEKTIISEIFEPKMCARRKCDNCGREAFPSLNFSTVLNLPCGVGEKNVGRRSVAPIFRATKTRGLHMYQL